MNDITVSKKMIGIFKEKGKYWFVTKEDVYEVLIERDGKPIVMKPKKLIFHVSVHSKKDFYLKEWIFNPKQAFKMSAIFFFFFFLFSLLFFNCF